MAALRRALKKRELQEATKEEEEEEIESSSSESSEFNAFDVLQEEEPDSSSSSSEEEPIPVPVPSRVHITRVPTTPSTTKPTEPKKEEDIDTIVAELGLKVRGDVAGIESKETTKVIDVLSMEPENFDPEVEMRRRFGSAAVRAGSEEQAKDKRKRKQRRHRRRSRKTLLIKPDFEAWPPEVGCTLDMEKVGTQGSLMSFAFVHSRSYEHVQQQFLAGLMSHDPDVLLALLLEHPYHVDTLLQMAEVYKMQQQPEQADIFIAKALWAFERAFHSHFNLSGLCRLPHAKHSGNWSFYTALYRRTQSLERKNAIRTCLELCKLMLSLDPGRDPVGALLFVDYFALRCGENEWLWHFFRQFRARDLSLLPNIAYNVALAAHRLEVLDVECPVEEGWNADGLLRHALLRFPMALGLLLDKAQAPAALQVKAKHPYFRVSLSSRLLDHLLVLFVERCAGTIWKDDSWRWLESNLERLAKELDKGEQAPRVVPVALYKDGVPHAVYRHVLLSDIQPAIQTLPANIRVIPANLYDHHLHTAASSSSGSMPREDRTPLGDFLRTLMPWVAEQEAALQQQQRVSSGDESEGHVEELPYE